MAVAMIGDRDVHPWATGDGPARRNWRGRDPGYPGLDEAMKQLRPLLREACVAAAWLAMVALGGQAAAQQPTAEPPAAIIEAPPPRPRLILTPVRFSALPGWADDQHGDVLGALLTNCDHLRGLRPEYPLGGDEAVAGRVGTPADWREMCLELALLQRALANEPRPGRNTDPQGRFWQRRLQIWRAARNAHVRMFIERRFDAYAAGTGIMTGYYEPELRGATAPDESFRTPLHARPPELMEQASADPLRRRFGVMRDGQFEPFLDRAAIDGGVLAGRGLEIVWVDDPVDAFFLHIQGSGRVILPNGELLRIGYAAQNGRPYVAVGRILIERDEMPRDRMSMQAIRAWLRDAGHDRAVELMRQNPSYIFFRRVEGLTPDQGPIGAMGVPLTPRRSVAVDRSFIPLGVPLFVVARDPVDRTPFGRTVVAQDTGGAIRGPARTDFFWGWGHEAGERAGRMREDAQVFVLLPRPSEIAGAAP